MNKYIDHTLLKADATSEQIITLCNEAKENDFKAVCINPSYIPLAKAQLEDSDVLVCTVVGFPLGANSTKVKVFEVEDAIAMGADEIDMVINIAKMKDRDYDYVLNEIKALRLAAKDKVLKVIVETAYLDEDEIRKASELCVEANVNFIKTSTGFASRGATLNDVEIMKSVVKDDILIKAAGGVRSSEDLVKMIEAGASRIGTSSGVALIKGLKSNSDY